MRPNLGDLCKDMVTGLTGICTSRTEWLNGCIRIGLTPQKVDKDGKPAEGHSFDEEQVKVIKAAAVVPERLIPEPPRLRQTGGPHPEAKRQEIPNRRS